MGYTPRLPLKGGEEGLSHSWGRMDAPALAALCVMYWCLHIWRDVGCCVSHTSTVGQCVSLWCRWCYVCRESGLLQLEEMVGRCFTVPEWMLDKMRCQMRLMRTDVGRPAKLLLHDSTPVVSSQVHPSSLQPDLLPRSYNKSPDHNLLTRAVANSHYAFPSAWNSGRNSLYLFGWIVGTAVCILLNRAIPLFGTALLLTFSLDRRL